MSLPGWSHVTHMSELEKRCASLWFKVDPATVAGPLTGLIVGECPGKNTRSTLPMFPYPANSSGGRLLKMSKLPVGVYLGKIRRRNLIEHHHEVWPVHEAEKLAAGIVDELADTGTHVLLLGKRVGVAFGSPGFFRHTELKGSFYANIPHPSGLSREYNNPTKRAAAAVAIQWCADWRV